VNLTTLTALLLFACCYTMSRGTRLRNSTQSGIELKERGVSQRTRYLKTQVPKSSCSKKPDAMGDQAVSS
jgi:hypothetical protein